MLQIFKNIGNCDSEQHFKINIQFHEDSFILTILEKTNAWHTKISRVDVTKSAKPFGISDEEYLSKLKVYLLGTPENVELKFAKAEFVCSCKAESANVKYFSTKLQKTDFNETMCRLLESYSLQNRDLEQQNQNLIKENIDFKEAKLKLENKLTELVDRKLEEEEQLYSNFTLVLNEKKRRIQHLNQLLYAFKSGRPTLNPQPKRKVKLKKEVKKEDGVSESESENENDNDGYNTDEENVNEIKINDQVLPSTSDGGILDSVFDELDAAGTSNLPKRQKVVNKQCHRESSSLGEHINDVPSTSKVQDESETSKVKMEVVENSPGIRFSTQDLLDCI